MTTVFKPTLLKTILLVLTAVWCPAVSAEDVTVLFNSTVTLFVDQTTRLGNGISVGDIALGSYTFNATPPNLFQRGQVDYNYAGTPYGINVNVGGLTFQTDYQVGLTNAHQTDFFIRIVNDYSEDGDADRDRYLVASWGNRISGIDGATNITVSSISWDLEDYSMTALDSTGLPSTAPDLSQWPSRNRIGILGCLSENYSGLSCRRPFFAIQAVVTEATKVSAQPTVSPSAKPSYQPSGQPSGAPSTQPSFSPSTKPSGQPSRAPSTQPSFSPSTKPTKIPSLGEQLEDVQASLNELLISTVTDKKDSERIVDAIEELSDVFPFPEDPADVTKDQFDPAKDAIKDLMDVETVDVTELIFAILKGYFTFVTNAFEQVGCSTGTVCNEDTVEKVNEKLASAQKEFDKGDFDDTLKKYKEAMKEVLKLPDT